MAPFSISRLQTRHARRAHDSSGMGLGNEMAHCPADGDDEDDSSHDDEKEVHVMEAAMDAIRPTRRQMSKRRFRRQLVNHFNILWERNQVAWSPRK
jgi:hypothetical protein